MSKSKNNTQHFKNIINNQFKQFEINVEKEFVDCKNNVNICYSKYEFDNIDNKIFDIYETFKNNVAKHIDNLHNKNLKELLNIKNVYVKNNIINYISNELQNKIKNVISLYILKCIEHYDILYDKYIYEIEKYEHKQLINLKNTNDNYKYIMLGLIIIIIILICHFNF